MFSSPAVSDPTLPVRRILFPVKPSLQVRTPVRFGVQLAARLGADLGFVHVAEPGAESFWRDLQITDDWIDHCAAGLTRPWSAILSGDPAREIPQYAAGIGADLLLLSPRRSTPVSRFLCGSVTAKVTQAAAIPILLAPADGMDPDHGLRGEKLVCLLNFTDDSWHVAACAARLAARLQLGLTLLCELSSSGEDLLVSPSDGEIVFDDTAGREKLTEIASALPAAAEIEVIPSGTLPQVLKRMGRDGGALFAVEGSPLRLPPSAVPVLGIPRGWRPLQAPLHSQGRFRLVQNGTATV